MSLINAFAAHAAKQTLTAYQYDPGPLAAEDIEIRVEHCGVCHSDLSLINNDWGISQYPIVPGHEAVGRISALGAHVQHLKIGQRVGIGWNAGSCMHCHECVSGQHNLCHQAQPTIVGHHGGFADKLRSHWLWAIPLPEQLDMASAGPLLCGGITVFAPFVDFNVKPTDHVGVVGIGGLGHMALKFARAWGCEVTAFSSNTSKSDQLKAFGAHHVLSSRDPQALAQAANTLDFLLVTVNVNMDWPSLLKTLKPNGRMHIVGAVLEPIPVAAMDLILGQKSVSGSPTGAPATLAMMLEFAARHQIAPQVEHFPMSQVNQAIAHLAAGKARYRIVLDADFK